MEQGRCVETLPLLLWQLYTFTRANDACAALSERYAGSELSDALRADFRKGSLPLMKYANILTFNTRAIVLYLSLLAGHPWFYFAFELVVMNILFLYMRNRHEALCRRMQQQYC